MYAPIRSQSSIFGLAEHHSSVDAELSDAIKAFNGAYASNSIEAYFGNYAESLGTQTPPMG